MIHCLQLEDVYSRSSVLNKWYKKIRIDGFSEGSVLVDYLVELNDLGRQVDTLEIKKLFHDSLEDAATATVMPKVSAITNREPKASSIDNESEQSSLEGKLSFGNFVVDPKYTDFISKLIRICLLFFIKPYYYCSPAQASVSYCGLR